MTTSFSSKPNFAAFAVAASVLSATAAMAQSVEQRNLETCRATSGVAPQTQIASHQRVFGLVQSKVSVVCGDIRRVSITSDRNWMVGAIKNGELTKKAILGGAIFCSCSLER